MGCTSADPYWIGPPSGKCDLLIAGQGQGAIDHSAQGDGDLDSIKTAEETRQSKAHAWDSLTLISPSVRAASALQVCDVAHLRRLVVSTDAGAWGGDHARRRSVELQVGPGSLSTSVQMFQGQLCADSA